MSNENQSAFRTKEILKVLRSESKRKAQNGIDALHFSHAFTQLTHLEKWLRERDAHAVTVGVVEGLIARHDRSELARQFPHPRVHFRTNIIETGVSFVLEYDPHKPAQTTDGLTTETVDRIITFSQGETVRVLQQQIVAGVPNTRFFDEVPQDTWMREGSADVQALIVEAYNSNPSIYPSTRYLGVD